MAMPGSRPDIQARTYDELFQFGGELKTVRREHQRILPFFAKVRTVLDVGCGRGVFMEMLRDVGITPVGVDLSPILCGCARSSASTGYTVRTRLAS